MLPVYGPVLSWPAPLLPVPVVVPLPPTPPTSFVCQTGHASVAVSAVLSHCDCLSDPEVLLSNFQPKIRIISKVNI